MRLMAVLPAMTGVTSVTREGGSKRDAQGAVLDGDGATVAGVQNGERNYAKLTTITLRSERAGWFMVVYLSLCGAVNHNVA